MSDPIDIVERLRGMSADHGPDGWPAVRMRDISALCDEITRLRALLAESLPWVPGRPGTVGAYANNNLRQRIADALPGDGHE